MKKPVARFFCLTAVAGALQFASAAGAKESVFFIGAHPDDTEGYAATAFLLKEKYDVHVVDLTRGELGLGMAGLKDGSTAKRRMAEEAKACTLLGATPHFLDEVDGFACAGEKSVDRLAGLFKQHRPKAVFTHWPVDEHVDHVQCWAVVANALRKSGLEPERYFFEVLMSQTRNFRPIYRVDVSRTIDDKARMLRCYACQNVNDGLVKEKLAQAALRGRETFPPVAAAEVFTTFDGRPIAGGVLEGLPETRVDDGVARVLMIGNSFSICCLKHLPQVAADRGVKLDLASLYIGGCPLSRHWANVLSNEVDQAYKPYQFDRNTMGVRTRVRMNVLEALKLEKWDVVTVQQASSDSWRPETYHPYGDNLVAKIREVAPQAKVFVQETWSYIPWDGRYKQWGIDQDEMYSKLHAAYADFAAKLDLPIIPFGTKVQEWRKRLPVKYAEKSLGGDVVGGVGWKPEHWFKRNAEGKWVCRCDHCHLGERGEYFQALVWAKSLLGVSVRDCGYKPDFVSDSDAKLMREIAEEN